MIHMKTFLLFVLVTGFFFCAPVGAKDNSEKKSKDDSYEKEHKKNHKQELEDEKPWSFKVNKTQGDAPLVVTFDASAIKPAKKYYWNFGNGDKLVTDKSMVTYQYKVAGTYTASLKFAVNASEKELKDLKDGGSIVIKVLKEVPPVNSPPVAALSCSVNNLLVACSGITSYDPENQPLIFKFDFADGFTETNTTGFSSHAYMVPGLYSVQLSVFDSAGASGVATLQVQAVKPPNQLPMLALNCSSDVINTLNCDANGSTDSDGNIISYSYSWDDSTNESKADSTSVTHVFSHSGTHSVTLTAVDNDGGVSTLTESFSVRANANPIAAFSCDNSKPLKLSCSSTSTDSDAGDAIQSYSWKFGSNSAFITTTNTTDYSFSAGGDVAVTLLVTDSHGGTNSLSKTFSVKENQLPTFDFNADIVSGIAPLKVHLQILNVVDADGTIASYNLNFGDETNSGTSDVVHTFNTPGTYSVVATVTDDYGGTTTKTKQIVVNALINNPPQVFFKIFEYDTEVELHATLTKTEYDIKRAYYTIDGGDTVEMSEFYPNTINWVDLKSFGQHEITLTVEDIYGQKDSFTHNFDLSTNLDGLKPYTDFTAKQSAVRTVFINLNKSFDFDADQTIQSFHVDFGNGEAVDTTDLYVTHTYPNSGTYPITVTAITNHGTSNSRTKEITLTDEVTPILQPVANFGYRIYDFAQNVSFYNDRSGTPNGSIISYMWDFGDGTTGSGSKVSHFYDPGSYLVTLTVVDSAGLQSSQIEHVTIFGPGSDLIAQIGCDIAQPYFDFTQSCQVFALDKLNQISRVRVTWGDGGANNLTLPSPNGIFKPSHKYVSAGNYPVTLTVTTTRGEVTSVLTSLSLAKYTPIMADVQCTTKNLLVSCNALGSYDILGRDLTYVFDYGDSFIDSNSNGVSSHAYSSAGTFNVKVTVKNSNGESALAQTLVMPVFPVNMLPTANLNCISNEPLSIKCNAIGSYDTDGTIVSFKYSWDDDTNDVKANDQEISHMFLDGGSHKVSLTITDNDGGQYTVTSNFIVNVNHAPVARINCTTNKPQAVSCYSLSYDEDINDRLTYIWYLDNVSISTVAAGIDYTFSESSTYKIKLEVTDSFGVSSNVETEVTTLENSSPITQFNCLTSFKLNLSCYSFSYDPDGTVSHIQWKSDDGFTSDEATFYHMFSIGGPHEITLTVTDDLGKTTTSVAQYNVIENILPSFEITTNVINGYTPLTVHLKASNLKDIDGTISDLTWYFDDGSLEKNSEIDHTFNESGSHVVRLVVIDNDNGVTEKRVVINVSSPSNLKITSSSDEGIANLMVHLDASSSEDPEGAIIKYEWSLKGRKIGEGDNIDINLDTVGDNDIMLTTTNSLGVKTNIDKIIKVKQPELYLAGSTDLNAFLGKPFTSNLFLAGNIGANSVSYALKNAPDGLSFNTSSLQLSWSPRFDQLGVYKFSLVASDGQHSIERFFRIEVLQPKELSNITFTGNNFKTILFGDDNEPKPVTVQFASQNTNIDIKVFQSKTSDGDFILWAEPQGVAQGEVTGQVSFIFDEPVIEIETNRDYNNSGSGAFAFFGKVLNYSTNCFFKPTSPIKMLSQAKDLLLGKYAIVSKPFYTGIDAVKFYVADNISTDQKNLLNSVVADTKLMNVLSSRGTVNVYFFNQPGGANGATPANSISEIYVNLAVSEIQYKLSELKHTIYHEYFHLIQAQVMNCEMPYGEYSSSKYIEGSAEYFGLSSLSETERKEWAFNNYIQYQGDAYAIYSFAIKNGIIPSDGNAYDTRHIWESYGFEIYSTEFFDYVRKHQSSFNIYGIGWDDFFVDYLKFKNMDIKHYLSRMTDALTTTNDPDNIIGDAINHIIKDPLLFKWNQNSSFLDRLDTKNNPIQSESVTLPPMSGRKFNLHFQPDGAGIINPNFPIIFKNLKPDSDTGYVLKFDGVRTYENSNTPIGTNLFVGLVTDLDDNLDIIIVNSSLDEKQAQFKVSQKITYGSINVAEDGTGMNSIVISCGSVACSRLAIRICKDQDSLKYGSLETSGCTITSLRVRNISNTQALISFSPGVSYFAIFPYSLDATDDIIINYTGANLESVRNSFNFYQ